MENQVKQLVEKKVIILGGSSGIGFATAKAAAIMEGAKVIIVSSNQQKVNEAVKQLPAGCEGYSIDLSKEENILSFFSTIGRFDHLIYTAGENLTLRNLSDTTIGQASQFFNLRFWGAFAAAKYASPHINVGGSICLTSGIASIRPSKGWTVAASICGAIQGFTRALAVELAPIRVNCIMPGVVKTDLWNSMPEIDRNNLYKHVGDNLLVKRVGEAEDIAQTFLYLMKQQFGTGQSIVVDGGAVLV